jgi:UDP-N-acetylmuramoylalanine--D-glutamate ligase
MNKKRVGVVGFGRTGKALLDFLLEKKLFENIFLYDDETINEIEIKENYKKNGVNFLIKENDFSKLECMDLIILSPGINARTERFNKIRKSVNVVSEIEFASTFINSKIIAVTGTNGKSTTVSLIHHILKNNGVKSIIAGNIGIPFISQVNDISSDSVVVLEVSSYQLEEIIDFRPYIAILLNVTPDHLDRYSSLEDYFSKKLNIFKNQKKSDYMILNYNDNLIRNYRYRSYEAKRVFFSIKEVLEDGAFVRDNYIHLDFISKEDRVSLDRVPLKGVHNLENILSSVIAARIMGIESGNIQKSIKGFKGLPHRMESLGKIGKVEFINDSKATNVDAALKSINSINENMILILGNKDKGGDFKLLESSIKQRVCKVFLIGSAAHTIYNQLINIREKLNFVKDLNEAVNRGYDLLKHKGGKILLAPGCASFDMFKDFEHRGEVFKKEVNLLRNRVKNG